MPCDVLGSTCLRIRCRSIVIYILFCISNQASDGISIVSVVTNVTTTQPRVIPSSFMKIRLGSCCSSDCFDSISVCGITTIWIGKKYQFKFWLHVYGSYGFWSSPCSSHVRGMSTSKLLCGAVGTLIYLRTDTNLLKFLSTITHGPYIWLWSNPSYLIIDRSPIVVCVLLWAVDWLQLWIESRCHGQRKSKSIQGWIWWQIRFLSVLPSRFGGRHAHNAYVCISSATVSLYRIFEYIYFYFWERFKTINKNFIIISNGGRSAIASNVILF